MRRFKGRQGRFLLTTVGGWIAARAWLLWPAAPLAIGGAVVTAALLNDALPAPVTHDAPPFRPLRLPRRPAPSRAIAGAVSLPIVSFEQLPPSRAAHRLLSAFDGGYAVSASQLLRYATYAPAPGEAAPAPPPAGPLPAPVAPHDPARRAIEGQAYLFVRPGSGRAGLAPGGSLGGSQVAARVAMALNRDGPVRLAAAARVYAPLHAAGAEAAVGLDWHPLPGVPLRISVERRIGLDAAGRDAWSAYAAGGFFRTLPAKLEADGYAQGGIVGARQRDLFVDAALRVGRRIEIGGIETVAGAGAWGAAQPGVSRIDVGPRLAAGLPVAKHRLSLAIEGRFRVAGHASPGSGAALTLAADL